MATTLDRQVEAGGKKASSRKTSRWVVGVLAATALAAVTVAAVAFFWPVPKVQAPEQASTTSSLYTPQEQIVLRLVAGGLVPKETLDGGIYLIKSLVNQGLIPRQTLNPYTRDQTALLEEGADRAAAGGRGAGPQGDPER